MSHTCHAYGCEKQVPPRLLACGRHWAMVPRDLQARIWATYRKGQENDKKPSVPYLIAQRLACAAIAQKEGFTEAAEDMRNEAAVLERLRAPAVEPEDLS